MVQVGLPITYLEHLLIINYEEAHSFLQVFKIRTRLIFLNFIPLRDYRVSYLILFMIALVADSKGEVRWVLKAALSKLE